MNKRKLQHQLWEESDGRTIVCLAGPDGDGARATLDPGARLRWVFEAGSHLEAMNLYHDRMEWPPYTANHPDDNLPYPLEWVVRQEAALAAMMGDREVIAASACANAWRAAAQDLNIRVESPFSVIWNDKVYWCSAWLPDFGGPIGTLIVGRYALNGIFDAADDLDFYSSGLNPYYYDIYDRAIFIETLNDWGWFGEVDAAPSWFKGKCGGHGGTKAT